MRAIWPICVASFESEKNVVTNRVYRIKAMEYMSRAMKNGRMYELLIYPTIENVNATSIAVNTEKIR